MTTIPSRLSYVAATVESFLGPGRQTRTPDHVYLFLPRWSTKEQCEYDHQKCPASRDRFSIITVEDDYGPITKLVPVLDVESSGHRQGATLVVTCDDDRLYSSTTIETLLHYYRLLASGAPDTVGAVACSGVVAGYGSSTWSTIRQPRTPIAVDFVEGTFGTLYSLAALECVGKSALLGWKEEYPEARLCDDLWTSAQLASSRFQLFVVPMIGTLDSECGHVLNSNCTEIAALSQDSGAPSALGAARAWLRNWRLIQWTRERYIDPSVFCHTVPSDLDRYRSAARTPWVTSIGQVVTVIILLVVLVMFCGLFCTLLFGRTATVATIATGENRRVVELKHASQRIM